MAKFSRAHFTIISDALRKEYEGNEVRFSRLASSTVERMAKRFARIFEQDNRAFSKERFFRDIGIPMEEAEENGTTEGR